MSVGEHLLAKRYELGRVLGQGGMAQVYDGHDRLLERRVAVKVLHPVYAADHEFLARFRREARAAASLSHAGIVAIYDTGQDGDAHYIVMEYVEGRTLAQALATGGALPPERAAAIAADVCEALAVAHGRGLVHRDVKPGNVMLTATGQVKVMDFGIARAIEGATVITTAMSVMGTPRYMSPEQVEGEPLDARSDLYSLGVLLYELLSGRVPFTGPTPIAVATQHVGAAPPPLGELAPDVPARLIAVTERALAKDPSQRPQSALAFAAELAAARNGGDPAPANGERRVRLVPVAVSSATTAAAAAGIHAAVSGAAVSGAAAGTTAGTTAAGTTAAGTTAAGTAAAGGTAAGAGAAVSGAAPGIGARVAEGTAATGTGPDTSMGAAAGSAGGPASAPGAMTGSGTATAGPGAAATSPAAGAATVPGRVGDVDGDGPSGEYQFGADYRLGPEYTRPGSNFGGPDDVERRRRNRLVAVLLGAVALLAVAGFALARGEGRAPSGGQEQPSDVATVPQVQGQAVEAARTALADAGFAVQERRVASDTVAAGEVIGLDPTAGTALAPGDTVGLLVSSGPASPGRGPGPAPGGAGPAPEEEPAPAPSQEPPAPSETAEPPAPSPSPTATASEPAPSPTASAEPSPTATASDPPTPDPSETATNPAPPVADPAGGTAAAPA